MSAAPRAPWRQPQQFGGLDLQHGGELANDFEANPGRALFDLAPWGVLITQ